MTQSRRDALKKLGIGTGVAWSAPAVTALVVPQHATAASSSSSSSSSFDESTLTPGSTLEFASTSAPGILIALEVKITSLNDASGATVSVLYSSTPVSLTYYKTTGGGGAPYVYYFISSAETYAVTSGTSYSVTVNSTTFTVQA